MLNKIKTTLIALFNKPVVDIKPTAPTVSAPPTVEKIVEPEPIKEKPAAIVKPPVKIDPKKIDRDLNKLYPPFRKEIEKIIAECHKQGLMVYVFEGFRPMERQAYLYQQGRSSPGKIVTNAGEGLSLHNYGLAVDLVFDGDKVKPGFQWTWSGNYEAVGALIKKNKKLVWAGTWRSFKEYPHVEIKLPFTAVQLKAIYDQKKDLKELWKFLDQEL